MKSEVKEQWLVALRGGNYEQAQEYLNDGIGGMCCLGVLLDITEPEGWSGAAHLHTREDAEMPDSDFLSAVKLPQDDAETLAAMNDEGRSFAEIADYIEENL